MLETLTAAQIRDACDELYRPDGFRHAPSQIFIDQFASADPPTTYLRVSFPNRFTDKAARQLARLGAMLQRHDECSHVVFCVYFAHLVPGDLALHSLQYQDR